MTTDTPEIQRPEVVVLRTGAPGLAAADLHGELEQHLPDRRIQLAGTPEREQDLVRDARVIVGNGISRELLDRATNLELYAHASSGTDSLPLEVFEERGIAVTNAAGLMPSISEQVLGYLLNFARDLREGQRRQNRREWRHYQPGELLGSTVTVVGLGAIGTQILARLEPFEVERIGIRHSPSKGGPAAEIYGYDDLHTALEKTEYLVLSCPLTALTRDLISTEELETLPNDAVVVNVSRGDVLDTDALVQALRRNVLGGAALDVVSPEPLPETHPLWTFENVAITPHNAGSSANHWRRLAELLAENLARAESHDGFTELRNQVVTP